MAGFICCVHISAEEIGAQEEAPKTTLFTFRLSRTAEVDEEETATTTRRCKWEIHGKVYRRLSARGLNLLG